MVRTPTAKVAPPSVPVWYVARPALARRLDEATDRRLTTVVAGAGFGKSTLLAAWAATVPSAWYTLDARDEALPTLARGLLDTLSTRLPDLPVELRQATSGSFDAGADDRALSEVLAAEIGEVLTERLSQPLVLVLDDVHEVGRDSAAARLIQGLVLHGPAPLHLVISSRIEAPFPVARLRGRGELLAIDAAQLAFSADEVAHVLADVAGNGAVRLAQPVHELTAGWPAAVRLTSEALEAVPPHEWGRVMGGLRRPGGPLFAYLAEEVFGREPEEIRELLRRVAPFDRFSVDLCAAVGVRKPPEILAGLVARGLFVQEQTGAPGWFVLHKLVRDFALARWPLSGAVSRDVLVRAARWFRAQGHFEDSLRALVLANDQAGIVRILCEHGSAMTLAGQPRTVIGAIESLAPERRDPTIEQVLGEAYESVGDWDRALASFEGAAGSAEVIPASLAWRMGRMHASARPRQALRILARGRVDGSDPGAEVALLTYMAIAHGTLAQQDVGRAFAVRALEAAVTVGDPRALLRAHFAMGYLAQHDENPGAALAHLRRAAEEAERSGDVRGMVTVGLNTAEMLNAQGLYDEALDHLDAAISLGELVGFAPNIAFALSKRGDTRLARGELDEARADYEASRALYQRIGSLQLAMPLTGLAHVFRERGDLVMAGGLFEQAVALAEEGGNVENLQMALAGLARVLAADDPEEASRLAERAVGLGPRFPYVSVLLAAGWVALARGDRTRAAGLAARAAKLAGTREERPGMAEALELRALSAPNPTRELGAVQEALALWRAMGNRLGQARVELALARLSDEPRARAERERANRTLRGLGVPSTSESAGLLAALGAERAEPAAVVALGGFRVLRDGKPVPEGEWQSKKARDLLKILVARRGRAAPKEFLMDALWPEQEPDKLGHRLAVALSTIRRILDPDRRRPPEHFVVANGEAVWVDLANLPIDVEAFLAQAQEGLSLLCEGRAADAAAVLESAEDAYVGDFLEEDPYEDWATPLREEARHAYVVVARALAESASSAGDDIQAARYWLRMLAVDPYDEAVHLRLVSSSDAAGRHGEARRRYRAYASRMEEIGVEPVPFPYPAGREQL